MKHGTRVKKGTGEPNPRLYTGKRPFLCKETTYIHLQLFYPKLL